MNLFRSKLAGFPYRASHSPGQTALSEWAAHSALKLGSTKRSALLLFSLHPNGAPSLHPSLSCERASHVAWSIFYLRFPLLPPSFIHFCPSPSSSPSPTWQERKKKKNVLPGSQNSDAPSVMHRGSSPPPLFHAPCLPLAHGPVPLYIY